MGRDVHARSGDEERDRQEDESEPTIGKENDAEECSRGSGVAAGEGVLFWTQTRAIPAQLVFDRRPRASGGNLDPSRYDSGQGAGQDHR